MVGKLLLVPKELDNMGSEEVGGCWCCCGGIDDNVDKVAEDEEAGVRETCWFSWFIGAVAGVAGFFILTMELLLPWLTSCEDWCKVGGLEAIFNPEEEDGGDGFTIVEIDS